MRSVKLLIGMLFLMFGFLSCGEEDFIEPTKIDDVAYTDEGGVGSYDDPDTEI